ncbi:hypothetical protein PSP6_330026 [Paraburkholderia tropica]|nr:hypothetical protein PSP6_330026 [Paraburkholderia tropica]
MFGTARHYYNLRDTFNLARRVARASGNARPAGLSGHFPGAFGGIPATFRRGRPQVPKRAPSHMPDTRKARWTALGGSLTPFER